MENECCICGTTCDFSITPRRISEVHKLKCQQMDRAAPSSPAAALCLYLWPHLPKLELQLLSTALIPSAFPVPSWGMDSALEQCTAFGGEASGYKISHRRSDYTHTRAHTNMNNQVICSSFLAFLFLSLILLILLFSFVKASWFHSFS